MAKRSPTRWRATGAVTVVVAAVAYSQGGLALVAPPSDEKCGKACGLWLTNPLIAMAGCPVICMLCFMCSPIETGRETYVAYDATGTPLGAKLVVPGQKCACCRNICRPGDPWLDLGATPVAARRDLVAAVVAVRCADDMCRRNVPTICAHAKRPPKAPKHTHKSSTHLRSFALSW